MESFTVLITVYTRAHFISHLVNKIVLYKKGPGYSHSNYAVHLVTPAENRNWIDVQRKSRVVSHVRKVKIKLIFKLNLYLDFDLDTCNNSRRIPGYSECV